MDDEAATGRARAAVAGPGSWPELRQAALAFAERGLLSKYFVSFDPTRNRALGIAKRLPGRLGRYAAQESARRDFGSALLSPVAVEAAWPSDLTAALVARATGRSQAHRRALLRHYRAFDRNVSQRIPRDVQVVLGQAGACSTSFIRARTTGARTVVNWNVPHWSMALREARVEQREAPEWAHLFGFVFWAQRLEREWNSELAAATHVLVPADLVARTFQEAGFPADRIVTVPYGVDSDRFRPREDSSERRTGPLRVLYVGELSQRKGLSYLFAVASSLPRLRFILRGSSMGTFGTSPPGNVAIIESGPDIVETFQSADVLLFPSLFDGFGLVILEALACGVPVISSSSAGGSEVIREGLDGYVVSPRGVDEMIERLKELDEDRDKLAAMKKAARARAEQYPWSRYRASLVEAVTLGLGDP